MVKRPGYIVAQSRGSGACPPRKILKLACSEKSILCDFQPINSVNIYS